MKPLSLEIWTSGCLGLFIIQFPGRKSTIFFVLTAHYPHLCLPTPAKTSKPGKWVHALYPAKHRLQIFMLRTLFFYGKQAPGGEFALGRNLCLFYFPIGEASFLTSQWVFYLDSPIPGSMLKMLRNSLRDSWRPVLAESYWQFSAGEGRLRFFSGMHPLPMLQ